MGSLTKFDRCQAPKPKNARNRVLEPDEWQRVYSAAPSWDRVDLERGRLYLPGHLTKNGHERTVPITPTLRRELQRLRGQDGVMRIQGLVFTRVGEKLNHTYREVQRLCQEQGIKDFVFHDLRHCAVTNLADAGVDTETIMKIVGHSSVEMFLRYRTIKAEKLDAAMARLNTLITRRQTAARQVSDITTL